MNTDILIVEDNPLTSLNIQNLLVRFGHSIVGVAASYDEAVRLYSQRKPDVTLLDVQLKGEKTGIDVAHFIRHSPDPRPFLFILSDLENGIADKIRGTSPLGYLKKPLDPEHLSAFLNVAKQERDRIITLPDGKHNVPVDRILYLQAEHVYMRLYLSGQGMPIMTRCTFDEILEQLPTDQFLRTHRSHAVNINQVDDWDKYEIRIKGHAIPISRRRRRAVLSRISHIKSGIDRS